MTNICCNAAIIGNDYRHIAYYQFHSLNGVEDNSCLYKNCQNNHYEAFNYKLRAISTVLYTSILSPTLTSL